MKTLTLLLIVIVVTVSVIYIPFQLKMDSLLPQLSGRCYLTFRDNKFRDLFLNLWKICSFHSHLTRCLLIASCNQFPMVLINHINMVRQFSLIIIPTLSPELLQIVRLVMDTCAMHLLAERKG